MVEDRSKDEVTLTPRLWRWRKSRSLARRLNSELREARADRTFVRTTARLRFTYSRSPYLVPQAGLAAILLAVSLIAGWGKSPPTWLDGAWQVTGVLIGLALAVFIFLLESITDRRFRSAVTFKAVIQRSAIEWPLGFGLTFIGYAVLALRFGGDPASTSTIPGWAESWIAGVFLLQIVFIGVSFARGIDLARPGAVASAMTRLFRTEALYSVETTIREQHSAEIIDQLCRKASETIEGEGAIGSSSYLSIGTPLLASKVGQVRDFDLELPSKIAQLIESGDFRFSAKLGDTISSGTSLAWLSNEPWTSKLKEIVGRGIVIGRSSHGTQAEAAFSEALDFAAREGLDQKSVDLDLTLEVIPEMFLEVHKAWLLVGNPDSHFSPRSFFPRSLEDEMGSRLQYLCDQFLSSQRPDLVAAIPQLSSNFMAIGRREQAPLVADQGFELCVWQCRKLSILDDEQSKKLLGSNAISALLSQQRVLRYILEDGHGPEVERNSSRDLLLTLNDATIRSLKALSDAGVSQPFGAWIKEFSTPRIYSSLESEVESLQFQASGDNPDPRVLETLEQQKSRLGLVQEVDEDMTDGIFQLGAWIAKSASNDADPSELWGEYLIPLAKVITIEALKASLTRRDSHQPFPLLNSWFFDEQTDSGRKTWSGDGSGFGLRWTAILFLTMSPSKEQIYQLLGDLDDVTLSGFGVEVEAVATEYSKWEFLVQGRSISETLEDFKAELAVSKEANERAEAERISSADVSPSIVDRIMEANTKSFEESQLLTRDLAEAGRVKTRDTVLRNPENTLIVETFMPKEFFIENEVYFDDDHFGSTLARERDRRLLVAIFEELGSPSALTLEGFVESVSRMPGGENRVIYASDTRSNRELVFRHPEYAPDRSHRKFGTLAGVDVFMISTDPAKPEVVALDRREIEIAQFAESEQAVIEMSVSKLNADLAERLLSRGKDPNEVKPSEVQEIVDTQVFVSASTAFDLDLENLTANNVAANLFESVARSIDDAAIP